ncbi:MAG TPA: IucA/IucC family protein [Pseudonocardiaceae bacterium]|nr:IucA/IucC family protein [Pseudonocardiaceae bacterium]
MACYLPGRGQGSTGVPGCDTRAEQAALAALRGAYPALAARYGAALRQARATALGKLWVALSREWIDGLVPSAGADRATLLLPNGTWLSAPPAITDAFAEHPAGLAVTLHGAAPQLIDHPVALLTAAMSARPHRADTDRWLQLSVELGDSVANHALALVGESWRRERLASDGTPGDNSLRWAARRAAADPGFSPLALFEQAVVDGHPFHPCARIRGGMTVQELFAYAPEWTEEVTVRIVAIAQVSFAQASFARRGITDLLRRWHPRAADAADAHLRGVPRDPADYELLPVHPWQLCRVLGDRYADALADGRVIVIPRARILARPLLSLRTLAPATDRRAAHIKTAVDIRLTTATRVVSPATAHNGPMMSALLSEICRREHGFAGRFVSLAEWASGSYRPAPGEPLDAAASLAAIARESPERHAGDGEVALPVAALAARSPRSGRPLFADVLDELASTRRPARPDTAERFLTSYCDCTLPALFTLLSRWGVALEPHGQNAVVVLRNGLPVRLLYRDFGSIRVSPARLTRSGLRPPALMGALPTDDEDELRAALFFPLVDTNLSQVVAALTRVGQTESPRLWGLVARCCRCAYATLTADPAIAAQAHRDEAALFGPTLPSKSMLRVHMSATPHAPQWVAVPNPLAPNPLEPGQAATAG